VTDTRPFDAELFDDASVDAETATLNGRTIELLTGQPEWWVTGADTFRILLRRGLGPFPAPVVSPRARTITITGKRGNQIPLRVIAPAAQPRGIHLYLHGGGWVLGSADMQDPMLECIADDTGQAVVAVEYSLAPEHPYPASPDDCEAAAAWLVENGAREFGTNILTIGGEAAGAHLSAITILRMRDRHGYTSFRGANLVHGVFDLSMTPSQRQCGETRLVIRTIDLCQFYNAFLPTIHERRNPDISPLYADLRNLCLALFTVGTKDPLLDDTLFMHARWVASGNRAELAIYPGGSHCFPLFQSRLSTSAIARMVTFLNDQLS
jgi:acetyl esterase/lipase